MEIILPYGVILLLLPLLLLPLYLLKTRNNDHRKKPNFPPGPPKLPIIGNLHQVRNPIHQSFSKLSKTYGPVMLVQFGCAPKVIISSAEAAEQIMKTQDLDFCTRPLAAASTRLSYNCIDILFSPYGEYWREIRKICILELFSKKRLQSFRVIREEEVDVLIDFISSNATPVVDVYEKFSSVAQKTVSRVAFGSITGQSHEKLIKNISEFELLLGSVFMSDHIPKIGWIIDRITGIYGKLEKCFHNFDSFFQQMIDEHSDPERLKKTDHDDIIDVLLKIKNDPQNTIHLTHNHIKAILQDVFLAGVDTSSVLMTWAMAALIKNPEAMKRVQEEIRSYVGSKGKVEESDLDNFQYLKLVIKETLRLHPPTSLIARESLKHNKIDGYDIYPKTTVIINIWEIMRNPKYWHKPEEFMPERFMNSPIEFAGNQYFEYLPFGGGRRACPGMNMGLGLAELVLANVLYAFNWELPKGMKKEELNMEEAPGSSVHRKYSLELVPVKYLAK